MWRLPIAVMHENFCSQKILPSHVRPQTFYSDSLGAVPQTGQFVEHVQYLAFAGFYVALNLSGIIDN